MTTLIIGNKGNMGRRYAAICHSIGEPVVGIDLNEAYPTPELEKIDRIIIATPTHTHLRILRTLLHFKKPILCEKPITTDMGALEEFLRHAEESKMQLSMVSQYDYFEHGNEHAETSYNYFKSGTDGLAWDCINIIWHARGKIRLSDTSPFWNCFINGRTLPIEMMDDAYFEMIEEWLDTPYKPQYDLIVKKHQKVVDYLDGKFD